MVVGDLGVVKGFVRMLDFVFRFGTVVLIDSFGLRRRQNPGCKASYSFVLNEFIRFSARCFVSLSMIRGGRIPGVV